MIQLGPIQLDFGFIYAEGNELTVASTINDPPKYRGGSPVPCQTLVAFSGNRLLPDSSRVPPFRQIEVGLVQIKDISGGDIARPIAEFTWHGLDGSGVGDESMKEALRITCGGPGKGVYVFGQKVA